MLFTYPFPLKSFSLLRDYTLEQTEKLVGNNFYQKRIIPPADILESINSELRSYNLPNTANFLAFKRRNWTKPDLNTVHVDYSSALDQLIHASIVLPIQGCANTSMFWLTGEYHTETRFKPDKVSYKAVVWESSPTMDNREEIVETTLCRVDIPHDAMSNIDGSYRTILSVRLQTNPTFEEILHARFGV
jgi:hypothetical protein